VDRFSLVPSRPRCTIRFVSKERREPGRKNEPMDIRACIDEFSKRFPATSAPVPFPKRSWESLRYQGIPYKDYLFGDLLKEMSPGMRELLWQGFKARCAAEGNWLPWLIYCLEPQWTRMFKRMRPRRPTGSQLFDDLPAPERAKAQGIFEPLCDQCWWESTGWRKPLLASVAHRLARDPHNRSSEWGKRMRCVKGGKHAQRRYREQGWHPLPWGLNSDRP
jgi:hypothetical protein